MWKNEHRNILIRNILVAVLLLLAVTGLVFAMRTVNQRISEEDALLKDVQSSQRQELSDARQESQELIQQTYQQHLDTVAEYLPGIVCWGDSLTAGSSGNVSYPDTLQTYIDTYLCDVYDLRYSLESVEGLSRLDWESYKISVPVVNMGAGREDSATILGRSGVVPYVVSSDFVIPAEVESVSVGIVSKNGKSVAPLTAGDGGVNPVTIAGVEGTLTRTYSSQKWNRYTYQFTRLEAGQEVSVTKGTEVVTASKDAYRDYIHIVWLGTYGDFTNPEKLVNDTKALLQRQNVNTDRYLVIGPCTYDGSWSTVMNYSMDSIDSAMLQAFGDRYVNLRKYLIEDGLRDAGLTATTTDQRNIQSGKVPSSFRSNASGADLNGVAYRLVGKLVYERMDRLGYFDDVREALSLKKSIQEILKDDPNYFENRLQSN